MSPLTRVCHSLGRSFGTQITPGKIKLNKVENCLSREANKQESLNLVRSLAGLSLGHQNKCPSSPKCRCILKVGPSDKRPNVVEKPLFENLHGQLGIKLPKGRVVAVFWYSVLDERV